MHATIHQVVTFATRPFHGNPAFVVSSERALDGSLLQRVAAQMNVPVLAALRPLSDRRFALAYYSPRARHAGAGHAALAAARIAMGNECEGEDDVVFDLTDGSQVIAARSGSMISFPWPLMPGTPVDMAAELGRALGARVQSALRAPFAYVAILEDPREIEALDPDLASVGRFDRSAIVATAPGTQSEFVTRVFAPKLDLPEDPVCGTAHRILAPYWAERLGKSRLHSRHLSQRGGDLWCSIEGDTVSIAGETKMFLTGTIELPGEAG